MCGQKAGFPLKFNPLAPQIHLHLFINFLFLLVLVLSF